MGFPYRIRYKGFYTGKYGNKRTLHKGVFYDSKKEGLHSDTLDLMVSAGEIMGYRGQVPFDLHGKNGTLIGRIKVDYLLDYPDGHQEVHEVKSYATQTDLWKWKMKQFIDEYSHIPYVVII